ncbi:MAG: AAA family ATPase [Gemmatimonadaceae bacterium]|nr:AAA family ATPase [Gemmatimonadaceae bacterium]
MNTQTDTLRQWVTERATTPWRASEDPIVVVAGAKGGLGTSTTAALMALTAAERGRRTLLIDTDAHVGTIHRWFGLDAPRSIADFARGDCSVDEAALHLADGLFLLPGGPGTCRAPGLTANDRRALHRRLSAVTPRFDLTIIDAGAQLEALVAAGTVGVRRLIAVGNVDPVALAASFALLKAADARWPGIPVEWLVPRHEEARARRAFDHLQLGSARFLGRELVFAGTIPEDSDLESRLAAGHTLPGAAIGTAALTAADTITRRTLAELDDVTRRSILPRTYARSS